MATDINTQIEGIKNQALGIQRNLSQFEKPQEDISRQLTEALPKPDIEGIQGATKESKTLLQKFAETQRKRIESESETALGEERRLQEREMTGTLESRRGFGTNISAVRELEATGRKRIKEIEKARSDALLLNDAEEASRLANLGFQEQQLVTQSRQSFFSNLLGLAGFETPQQKRERELAVSEKKGERELSISRKQQLDTLKANFANIEGITEAKTLEEAIGFLGPQLQQDRDLQVQLQRAQIRAAEAAVLAKENSSGGEPLPASQVVNLSDAKFLPSVLDKLEQTINDNEILFGVAAGRGSFLFTDQSAKVDAELRRAAQVIGRFMEGGVLRAEDEVKYRKMLPQLTDRNPSVARSKLKGIREMLSLKYNQLLQDFGASGFDISGFEPIDVVEEITPSTPPESSGGVSTTTTVPGNTYSGIRILK